MLFLIQDYVNNTLQVAFEEIDPLKDCEKFSYFLYKMVPKP